MKKEELVQCHNRITPYIHRTPILSSILLNKMVGASLFFKCENFQRGGAYKIRGATNAILQLSEEQKQQGVVTHSSGNFAQALSLASKSVGVKATIVMPSNAPEVKKAAVATYEGKIVMCEPTIAAREAAAQKIVSEQGATFIHPSNDIQVIVGQGTVCLELLEELPDLNCVVNPVGGGGLIAGSSIAAHHFGTQCKVIGSEPFEADDAYRSLISGKIETNLSTNTIADGLRTQLGDQNFPIILSHVDRIIRVTEEEIIHAMRLIWERMKIIIEPSSAVTFAAILKEKESFANQKVGLIISGGNVDVANLPF